MDILNNELNENEEKVITNVEEKEEDGILYKLGDVNLDALLTDYVKKMGYGTYEDYEVYKTFSLASEESYIDFLRVKVKTEENELNEIFFGLVVINEYLCSLDEIDKNNLHFDIYLESLLISNLTKSLKYDYMMMQQEMNKEETTEEKEE